MNSDYQVDTLQGLLLKDGEQDPCITEREQKLVSLLKVFNIIKIFITFVSVLNYINILQSGKEEIESLLQKQEDLKTENGELRDTLDSTIKENERLHERVRYYFVCNYLIFFIINGSMSENCITYSI